MRNDFRLFPTCCYYPTTVLMVDDNADLLKDIAFGLMSGPRKYKSRYSTVPQEIIDMLKKQEDTPQSFIAKYTATAEEYFDTAKTIVRIDIPAIHQILYETPLRFDQYVVLIVDYAMPDMNGLALCQHIRQVLKLPIKIIMLTGEADQTTAVQAFNDKAIDRFVLKSDPDYIRKILEYLHELHMEYFEEITRAMLAVSPVYQQILWKDSQFLEFFNTTAHQHQAVEYYLLEESGSFLFLDARKNVTRLIIKTEEDILHLYELAADDRSAPAAVIEGLKQCKKLAYFSEGESDSLPVKQWHLYDTQPLPGVHAGYYAILKGIADHPLEMDKITSYQEFLNA